MGDPGEKNRAANGKIPKTAISIRTRYVPRWRYLYFLLQYQRRKHTISTILDREHRWFLVFKTPLNMSEGERRTALEVAGYESAF
jgi:hypothetical protein